MSSLIAGRLFVTEWRRPWMVGKTDIRPHIFGVLTTLHTIPVSIEQDERVIFRLMRDARSRMRLSVRGPVVLLTDENKALGACNVKAHLYEVLKELNGRLIEFHVNPGDSFLVKPDSSEKVHGVYYIDGGNVCTIHPGDENAVCGLGAGANTCAFLSISGGGEYQCIKFSMLAQYKLECIAYGVCGALRIGSCECLGGVPTGKE